MSKECVRRAQKKYYDNAKRRGIQGFLNNDKSTRFPCTICHRSLTYPYLTYAKHKKLGTTYLCKKCHGTEKNNGNISDNTGKE